MLTGIRIANFKGFSEVQQIPIRPLTVLFGPNSAGKSSLIHAFLLANEANRSGTLDVHQTHLGENSVDLGGFRQYVHRRRLEEQVQLGFDFDLAWTGGAFGTIQPSKSLKLDLSIGIDSTHTGSGQRHPVNVMSYDIELDSNPLLRAVLRSDGTYEITNIFVEHQAWTDFARMVLSFHTRSPSDERVRQLVAELPSMTSQLSGARERLLIKRFIMPPPLEVNRNQQGPRTDALSESERASLAMNVLSGALSEFFGVLELEVSRVFDTFTYLGPLRSYPPRRLFSSEFYDMNWHSGGGSAWDLLRQEPAVRQAVNFWLGSPERMQAPYALPANMYYSHSDSSN